MTIFSYLVSYWRAPSPFPVGWFICYITSGEWRWSPSYKAQTYLSSQCYAHNTCLVNAWKSSVRGDYKVIVTGHLLFNEEAVVLHQCSALAVTSDTSTINSAKTANGCARHVIINLFICSFIFNFIIFIYFFHIFL